MRSTTLPLSPGFRALAAAGLSIGLLGGCAAAAPSAPPAGATATPTTVPSPSPTPDHQAAATAALAKFSELIRTPTLAMHLEQTATMSATAGSSAGTLALTFRIDKAGQDFAGTIYLAGKMAEVRYVGGTAYARAANGAWGRAPLDPGAVDGVLNPWQYMGPVEALRFLSRRTSPSEAYVFGNTAPIPYQTAAMRAQNIGGQLTSIQFVVRADGVPIELTLNGEAFMSGAKVTFASLLVASRVGEAIKIERP